MRELDSQLNQLTQDAIGAAIEVHRLLGPGFLEAVYEEALCIEFTMRGIPFERQTAVNVTYKGYPVGAGKIDLLVKEQLVIELKTVEILAPIHSAQVISYLKATGLQLGLLINFNVVLLKQGIKRIILS